MIWQTLTLWAVASAWWLTLVTAAERSPGCACANPALPGTHGDRCVFTAVGA